MFKDVVRMFLSCFWHVLGIFQACLKHHHHLHHSSFFIIPIIHHSSFFIIISLFLFRSGALFVNPVLSLSTQFSACRLDPVRCVAAWPCVLTIRRAPPWHDFAPLLPGTIFWRRLQRSES